MPEKKNPNQGGKKTSQALGAQIPEYLKRWPGLYMRQGDQIVQALAEDIETAKSYPGATNKGAVVNGRRITILCRKDTYQVGEEVRVIHVLEVLAPGQEIFIMGPKAVVGEIVDGHPQTPKIADDLGSYDGRVLASPGVDYNYDITTYSFDRSGLHTITWRLGELLSNTLELKVVNS